VDANSGWSGVGSALLDLVRDEYGKIPIFCISSLTPPPPSSSTSLSTFASQTSPAQSLLNASMLLSTATQLANVYLPLTTCLLPTSSTATSGALDLLPPDLIPSLCEGSLIDSTTFFALCLHLATASYRLSNRSMNMASALAGLTQQTSANIVALKWMKMDTMQQAVESFNPNVSSSLTSFTPTLHIQPGAMPLSLLGHAHSYPPLSHDVKRQGLAAQRATPSMSTRASLPAIDASSHEASGSSSCDHNRNLTEILYVFGAGEEMSHAAALEKARNQSHALFRHVFGTTSLNLPPSFPSSYYDTLNGGNVSSLYRCTSVGVELNQLGRWITSLHKGTINRSAYQFQRNDEDDGDGDGDAMDVDVGMGMSTASRSRSSHQPQPPVFMRAEQTQGSSSSSSSIRSSSLTKMHELGIQLSQDAMDELHECGVTMQNLAEMY